VGKYEKYIEYEDNARALTVSNIRIANELAEANRLKRLELNLIHDINKQSLEDQA